MAQASRPKQVSVLALPESTGTPIHGLYETLVLVNAVAASAEGGAERLFDVEIVGRKRGIFPSACGLPLEVHRAIGAIDDTDIVIVASMLIENLEWVTGRHSDTVEWLQRMHHNGADLCTACAGALLLAETGLLTGLDTTTHWAFAPTFRQNFPDINLRIDELLIVAGANGEFVVSGAANSWQDLVIYLISRHASPTSAQAIGKFLLYHWDSRSQAPFVPFAPPTNHGDSAIRQLQDWLSSHDSLKVSVDEMARQSGMPGPTFSRRFRHATGYSPARYLQHLRVEEAKRLLERTDHPVEVISWDVGYEEPAAFRRVFKRLTSLSPGEYRRKFCVPVRAVVRQE